MTPEPPWASDPRYVLGPEVTLRVQLLEAERKVEQAQKEKEAIVESLALAGRFRALLFEKGKHLEGNNILDESGLCWFELFCLFVARWARNDLRVARLNARESLNCVRIVLHEINQ